VSALELFWFALSTVQVAFAAYAFAALVSWRGERLWPAPGRPLRALPAIAAGCLFALAVFTMLRVGDADLSRYVGTGALMLVAVTVFVMLLLRGRSP
jgi:hypothetical protein